jgi:RND family efflux transporter MFP subunit
MAGVVVGLLGAFLLAGAGFLAMRLDWVKTMLRHSEPQVAAEVPQAAAQMPSAPGVSPPKTPAEAEGPRRIQLSRQEQQLAGIATEPVAVRTLTKVLHAVGKIDYDERRIVFVPARIAGRLEKLYVNFTGATVKPGQPLALIYSPELVASQQEYLLAEETYARVRGSSIAEVAQSAASLVEASRQRLLLWGVTAEQIAQLKAKGTPALHMPILSPIGGTVVEKMAFEGKYVMEGEALYKVADLSQVWALAEVFEPDLPWVRLGQRVEVAPVGLPGKVSAGTVRFVDPAVNPETRTIKLRADLPNPGGIFKPGMYVNVTLKAALDAALAVPRSAVLDTGLRQLVYVDKGNGLYEGREVVLGPETEGYYPVLKGLAAGERVVVAGTFLLDSQSQLASTLQLGSAEAAPAEAGEKPALKIDFATSPKSPVVGKNTFRVKLTDPAGKPVTDARVVFVASMPPMPGMPGGMSLEEEAKQTRDGEYSAAVQLVMQGAWKVVVTVERPGQPPASKTVNLTVK